MVSGRVVSEAQLNERLEHLGYSRTSDTSATGRFWRSKGGAHLLVPNSVDGFYPDWLLTDLEKKIGKLNPWTWPLRGEDDEVAKK